MLIAFTVDLLLLPSAADPSTSCPPVAAAFLRFISFHLSPIHAHYVIIRIFIFICFYFFCKKKKTLVEQQKISCGRTVIFCIDVILCVLPLLEQQTETYFSQATCGSPLRPPTRPPPPTGPATAGKNTQIETPPHLGATGCNFQSIRFQIQIFREYYNSQKHFQNTHTRLNIALYWLYLILYYVRKYSGKSFFFPPEYCLKHI